MVSYHVLARMFMENTRNQNDINVAYQQAAGCNRKI